MFSVFGLYVYLCFGFHLLAPLRSFTTLFFHLYSAQPTSLFHLILPVGLSTYGVPPFRDLTKYVFQVIALLILSTLTLSYSRSYLHSLTPSQSFTHYNLSSNLFTSTRIILLNSLYPCC